jgi:hypothetical protein
MKTIYLFDLDHTLTDAAWRDGMIAGAMEKGDWDEYHKASAGDFPVPEMVSQVNSLYAGRMTTAAITSRPEKWRKLTMSWLCQYDVLLHQLIMRPDDNYMPSSTLKIFLAKQFFGESFKDIAMITDDREDVLAPFRAHGIATQLFTLGRK